jgi:hypothetical protein
MPPIPNPPHRNPLPAAQPVKDLPGPYRKRVPSPTLFSSNLLKINKIPFLVFSKSFKINKLFLETPNRTPSKQRTYVFPASSQPLQSPSFTPTQPGSSPRTIQMQSP